MLVLVAAIVTAAALVVPTAGDLVLRSVPAAAVGVGEVSPAEWLPLRTTTGLPGGGALRVGCTRFSPGLVCNGHHSYWALDLAVQQGGTPVYAAGAGQVTVSYDAGWGTYVIVNHGGYGQTLYGHLGSVDVAPGQWVDQNTRLGTVGQTGAASTPHLHFEYNDTVGWFGSRGSPNDPGHLKACHGNQLVTYGDWEGLVWGSRWVYSDGTSCGSAPVASTFHPIEPFRALDSRPGPTNVGPFTTPWASGGARDVPIGGLGSVPANADAVVLNVTAVNPTASSFVQLWPAGAAQPVFGSSLNVTPGQTVANAVTVKLGTAGSVRVFNLAGSVDLVIDVAGYYLAGTAGAGFEPITPVRVVDSRVATNVGVYSSPWTAGLAGARDEQIAGLGSVPSDAVAVVLNVTAVGSTGDSFLQLWPTGSSQPMFGSTVNFSAGQTVPNAATVKLGDQGHIRVLNAGGDVDVVIDVTGYYTATGGSAFHAIVPSRVLDSRPGTTNIGAYSSAWDGAPAGTRTVPVAGGVVPGDASAVVINLTGVEPTVETFVQLWPAGVGQPVYGSSLNLVPGEIRPNAVTVGLGPGGNVQVANAAGSVHLVADVAGYFG